MKVAKAMAFIAGAFVLTALGIGLMVAGVHGPSVATYAGAFLILPSVILTKIGVPTAIPVLYRTTVIATAFFCILQLGYYYALLRLMSWVLRRKTGNTLGVDG